MTAGEAHRRIAPEPCVGVGAVKTHVNHLYRKLDAHSRTRVVARAGELDLLYSGARKR